MRVLFVAENFPLPLADGYEITGGVERAVLAFAQWTAQRHDLCIVTNRRCANLEPADLRVEQCGTMASYSQRGGLRARFAFQREAVKTGLAFAPDVVVGWNFISYTPALKIARKACCPALAYYHDVWIGRWLKLFGLAGLMGEILERRVLAGPWAGFMANSDWTASQLVGRGISLGKVKIVPPPVLAPAMPREEVEGKRSIAAVARLVPYKRVDVLLRAFAEVAGKFPGLQLRIVGSGPARKSLEGLARQLGIADAVIWHGWLEKHSDVLSVLAQSRLYVTASEVEGFGISTIEAASQGTPYVATDIPAIRFATRNGQGGCLFEAGNPSACARAMETLLADDELWRQKVVEGSALPGHYGMDTLGPQFEQILLDAKRP